MTQIMTPNLCINFIRSNKFSFSYWNDDTLGILNIMVGETNMNFKNSNQMQSFITYLKTIRFNEISVVWTGTTPDIELSDFIETLNISRKEKQPESRESHPTYPTVFNPFEHSPSATSNITITSKSTGGSKTINKNALKIDLKTILDYIKQYPAHPNLQDASEKNKQKIKNYIISVLGKNMESDYLEQLTLDVIDHSK